MREINIIKMKLNEIETMSSTTIGSSKMIGVHSIGIKNNQSFGQEQSDGTIHVRSIGKINDCDHYDANVQFDVFNV